MSDSKHMHKLEFKCRRTRVTLHLDKTLQGQSLWLCMLDILSDNANSPGYLRVSAITTHMQVGYHWGDLGLISNTHKNNNSSMRIARCWLRLEHDRLT